MNKSFPAVLTALTVIFLVALGMTFVLRMEHRRSVNLADREAQFRAVARSLGEAYREGEEPASTATREIVTEHLEAARGPRVFAVYSYDTGLEYLWTYSPAYIRSSPSANVAVPGLPSFSYNDLTEGQLSRSVQGHDEEAWIVEAIYPLLLGSDFFIPLRDSLVALVAFATLMLIIALVASYRERQVEDGAHYATAGPHTPAGRPRRHSEPTGPRPEHPTTPAEIESFDEFDFDLDHELPPVEGPEQGVGRPPGHEAIESLRGSDGSQPGAHAAAAAVASVPDERTPLAQQVGEAVERTAAEGENLVLALLQFPEPTELRGIERVFDREVEISDLEDGRYAVLIPDQDVRGAFQRFERFQAHHAEQTGRYDRPAPSVGITARNDRLVSGDRLITEARVALQRAKSEPRRIVGFSADPDRFRNYIVRRS